jgi:biopolymer transport protein ExbB
VIETDPLILVAQGGVVVYPLLLCSVVSVTIIFERLWSLTRGARQVNRLQREVDESLGDRSLAEVVAICRRDRSPLGAVYRAVLASASAGTETRARIAQRKLGEANRRLRRFVWLLGTIGSLAPFIGLFGTVIGIIRAFENMAATGSGGFAVVAAGISEALVATAGGLLVGVLSIFAYNAFQVRISTLLAEWREQTDEFLAHLADAPPVAETHPRVVQSR